MALYSLVHREHEDSLPPCLISQREALEDSKLQVELAAEDKLPLDVEASRREYFSCVLARLGGTVARKLRLGSALSKRDAVTLDRGLTGMWQLTYCFGMLMY